MSAASASAWSTVATVSSQRSARSRVFTCTHPSMLRRSTWRNPRRAIRASASGSGTLCPSEVEQATAIVSSLYLQIPGVDHQRQRISLLLDRKSKLPAEPGGLENTHQDLEPAQRPVGGERMVATSRTYD